MHIYTRRIPMESSANEIIIKEESRQQSYEISQLKSRNEELLSVIKIISFELDNNDPKEKQLKQLLKKFL